MMYQIRPARDTDFDQVLTLLERLQSLPEHHIGYHGETRAELASEYGDMDWPNGTFLAVDENDRIHGVLTAEIDAELGRVWWHGPFVDVPADHPAADRIWERTADALYAEARRLPALRDIADSELFGHVANHRLAQFAQRNGFPGGTCTTVFTVDGVDLVRMIGSVPEGIDSIEIEDFPTPPTNSVAAAAFIRLHDECFPNTNKSAAQVLSGDADHTVVVAMAGGRLVGYAVGSAQPVDYYVDFVAVAPDFRGKGIAGALMTVVVQRLADRNGPRQQVCTTVVEGNAASRQMHHKLGFRPLVELVGYRLRAPRLVS
jgi:GNAT superfamily N-acetyltransferase